MGLPVEKKMEDQDKILQIMLDGAKNWKYKQVLSSGLSPRTRDLVGKKFGLITVIKFGGYRIMSGRTCTYWLCRCECGLEWSVRASNLISMYSCHRCASRIKNEYTDREFSALNNVFLSLKAAARYRNLRWEITVDQFREITRCNCFYCDKPPSNKRTRRRSVYIYNGLDRVDNSQGYIISNVVACCQKCNTTKSDLSFAEFEKIYLRWMEFIDRRNSASKSA